MAYREYMSLEECIEWVASLGGRIEFGAHPHNGDNVVAIYLVGPRRIWGDGSHSRLLIELVNRERDLRESAS